MNKMDEQALIEAYVDLIGKGNASELAQLLLTDSNQYRFELLHIVVRQSSAKNGREIVRQVIEHGPVSVHDRNNHQETPLDISIRASYKTAQARYRATNHQQPILSQQLESKVQSMTELLIQGSVIKTGEQKQMMLYVCHAAVHYCKRATANGFVTTVLSSPVQRMLMWGPDEIEGLLSEMEFERQ